MRLIDADALIQYMNDQGISFNADVNEAILNARTIGNYAEYVDRVWEIAYERGKNEALQWIPCSERLPDISGWYLVTNDGNTEIAVWSCDLRRWAFNEKVTAWMPFPDPYGGNSE